MEIWTMRLSCGGAKKVCHMPCDFQLHDLCPFILECFEFDHDHLHQFFLSKTGDPYRKPSYILENENLQLREIFPIQDKFQLYFHFDFGDSWVFKIMKTRKNPFQDDTIRKPKLIEEIGENPEQYPEYD